MKVNPEQIAWQAETDCLLLHIDKEAFGLLDEPRIYRGVRFEPKSELHITLTGRAIGRQIRALQAHHPAVLAEVVAAARTAVRTYTLTNELYRGAHTKEREDVRGNKEIVHAQSIIVMVQVEGMRGFYTWLGNLLRAPLEIPPTHITLYTRADPHGIGIATQAEFETRVKERILPGAFTWRAPDGTSQSSGSPRE